MRALRVLLATLIAVPLLAWSASEGAIALTLRDVDRPRAPKVAPSLAHRGLACVEGSSAKAVARLQLRNAGWRSLERIPREWALTLWLTRRYESDELIRMQGDSMWFGRGARGLEAGSQAWFGKPLSELSSAQTALLVGMAQGPSNYDPTRHPGRAAQRRQFVLGKLQTCGLVPPGSAIAIHGTSAMDGVVGRP
jgi:penicillin-binding protein 1A